MTPKGMFRCVCNNCNETWNLHTSSERVKCILEFTSKKREREYTPLDKIQGIWKDKPQGEGDR